MSSLTISVRDAEPNPALVIALRRATGGQVGDLAAAVFNGTPLIEEDVAENADAAQIERIEQLLALLRVTALQVVIARDGREIPEEEMLSQLRVWRTSLARLREAR